MPIINADFYSQSSAQDVYLQFMLKPILWKTIVNIYIYIFCFHRYLYPVEKDSFLSICRLSERLTKMNIKECYIDGHYKL